MVQGNLEGCRRLQEGAEWYKSAVLEYFKMSLTFKRMSLASLHCSRTFSCISTGDRGLSPLPLRFCVCTNRKVEYLLVQVILILTIMGLVIKRLCLQYCFATNRVCLQGTGALMRLDLKFAGICLTLALSLSAGSRRR